MRPEPSSPAKTRLQAIPNQDVAPDPGIASYFVWLRRHTGLSIHQTAALIQTESEVISALEAGSIADLPAWPETVRIVSAYAQMAQVDARGPLQALQLRWPTVSVKRDRKQPKTKSLAAANANRLSLRLW